MAAILIRHQVENYKTWRAGYDAHDAARRAAGGQNSQVFRSADNPNEVVVLLGWDTVDNARAFAQSDDLREAMQNAGVVSKPDIVFLNGA